MSVSNDSESPPASESPEEAFAGYELAQPDSPDPAPRSSMPEETTFRRKAPSPSGPQDDRTPIVASASNDTRRQAWKALRLAASLLTVIPMPLEADEATDADVARSRWAYPIVGMVIGLGLGGLSFLLSSQRVGGATFWWIASWVAITGGIHLDGLADTADGLFLDGDADRRLTVMRDPRVGSFGVVAVVLVILGKYACLTSMAAATRTWAILGAAAIGRTILLVAAGRADSARTEGMGRVVIESATSRDAVWAAGLVVVVAVVSAGSVGFVSGTCVLGLAFGLTRLCQTRLGGLTGDTLGALVELSELVFLLAVVLGR